MSLQIIDPLLILDFIEWRTLIEKWKIEENTIEKNTTAKSEINFWSKIFIKDKLKQEIPFQSTDHLPSGAGQANGTWKPCIWAVEDFTSCFLFSLETQHTIGYDSIFKPFSSRRTFETFFAFNGTEILKIMLIWELQVTQ
jgi:hypothetical protein